MAIEQLVTWARAQLVIAGAILDNPGGGLVFATQTIGQVRSALVEGDSEKWAGLVALLDRVEDAAVRREYKVARTLLDDALGRLSPS